MKKVLLAAALSCAMIFAGCSGDKTVKPTEQWTPEKAQAWYDALPWLSGCNYTPANAINTIEMWSADTYETDCQQG